jgi:carbohydrate kinase (thermoresistant glucokinase family)
MALRVVVMGVSGCGKSTVGQGLAQALGVPYIEGDALHPARNVALMAAGTPLTDADRQGWLQAVADELAHAQATGAVVSCSALKRSYRQLLRASAPDLKLIYLRGDQPLLAERMRARSGHYMPASLLQSQLDTLEPPGADESAFVLDIAAPPEQLVRQLLRLLSATTSPRASPA